MAKKSNKTLIKVIVGCLILVVGAFALFQLLPTLIMFAGNTLYFALMILILAGLFYLLIRFIKW